MRIAGASISASLAPQNIQNGKDPITFQGLQAGGTEGQFGYNIPNILIDYAMRHPHITSGFWRGVNVNPNAIYTECFIDELAHELKQDPLAFRLKMLKPKHAAVLKAVADKIGWGTPAPQGVFRGLAQFKGYASYVAAAAEVSVSERRNAEDPPHRRRHRSGHGRQSGADRAADDGLVRVRPVGAAYLGECTVKDGAIEQKNFDTYQVLRIRHMPKVETIVMPSGGPVWGGVGEPTIAVAAPAVLNAIFAATGKRQRSIPIKNSGHPHGLTKSASGGRTGPPLALEQQERHLQPRSGRTSRHDNSSHDRRHGNCPCDSGMAVAGPADIPAGAAACSGCHPAKQFVATQVPRLTGRNADADRRRDDRISLGRAARHRDGPHRQGLYRRRDQGDRRLVRRAEGLSR